MRTNGVLGSSDPLTFEEEVLDDSEEQQIAKMVKSKEWKFLKDHLEQRIDHYRDNLPGGKSITEIPAEELKVHYLAKEAIVQELKAIINFYEGIGSAVSSTRREEP